VIETLMKAIVHRESLSNLVGVTILGGPIILAVLSRRRIWPRILLTILSVVVIPAGWVICSNPLWMIMDPDHCPADFPVDMQLFTAQIMGAQLVIWGFFWLAFGFIRLFRDEKPKVNPAEGGNLPSR
jgi:hypothetical protein